MLNKIVNGAWGDGGFNTTWKFAFEIGKKSTFLVEGLVCHSFSRSSQGAFHYTGCK